MRTDSQRSSTATDASLRVVQTRANSSGVAGGVVTGHGLGAGSPIRLRENAPLTRTLWWTLRSLTCDLCLCGGGAHPLDAAAFTSSRARTAEDSEPTLPREHHLNAALTSRFVWALQALNLRPPPCKSGRSVSKGPGQGLKTGP